MMMKKFLILSIFMILGSSILFKVLDIPFIGLRTQNYQKWSIGSYIFSIDDSFKKVVLLQKGKMPTLTAKDVTDRKAEFVADPFVVYENGIYYMFFEVFSQEEKGDIAVATSKDGMKWRYEGVILDEPFHLSYPYVFRWKEKYYMVPESSEARSIRLYEAIDFPFKWRLKKVLLENVELVDPVIINYKKKWWLFATSSDNANLYLYYADRIDGVYRQHPQSPIIKNNPNVARGGGNIIFMGNKLIRIAQDDAPSYGNSIRIFEITKLTTEEYKEKELNNIFLSKISREEWNRDGIHQLSLSLIKDDRYIVVVDGYKNKRKYEIYVKLPYAVGKFLQSIVR